MKIKRLLLIICIFVLSAFQANATHIMGSDMTYKSIGNNVYEVTLNIYRDCGGIVLGTTSGRLRYFSTSGSVNQIATLKSITNITPVCDTFTNAPCTPINTAQSGRGAEKHTYVDTIDLNLAANSALLADNYFTVSWTTCCRNGSITTGVDASFYTFIEIFTNFTGNNNSPYFYEMPFARLNVNRPFQRNFGGYDLDGDSLTFELVDPLTSATQVSSYNSPFSKDDPFTTFKPAGVPSPNPNLNPPVGFHLDQQTGLITFTPTLLNEVSVVVLEVREYRNGNLISRARREMQFWIENIDNNLAHLVTAPAELCISAGDTLQFDILTDDSGDTLFGGMPDSIRLVWDSPVVGPIFSSDLSQFETGKIKWVPSSSDVRKEAYMFTFSAIDNTCPYNHIVQKTVRVYVNSSVAAAPSASFTWSQVGNKTVLANTTQVDRSNVSGTEWWINGNLASTNYHFDTALILDSNHTVKLKMNYSYNSKCGSSYFTGTDSSTQTVRPKSCKAKYIIAVDADTTNPFRIFLVNTSTGTGLTSVWRFSDGDSVVGTGSHNFTKFGKYEVCLEISSATCSDTYCDSLGMDSLGNLRRMSGFTIVMLDEDDLVSAKAPENSIMSIYPNPFDHWISIENSNNEIIKKVEVLDLHGRLMLSEAGIPTQKLKLNTTSLATGTYLIRTHLANDKVLINKIIKN